MKNERTYRSSTTNTDLIKAMLAENPRYSVQEIVDAINISRKTVDNHLTTCIDENRLYESRFYVQFFFRDIKRSFFKEAYYWRVDLDFVSKCIENALDLRTIDFQLAKFRLHLKKVLLSICWNWKDILYYELFSRDKTINFRKYCNQLDKFKTAIVEK